MTESSGRLLSVGPRVGTGVDRWIATVYMPGGAAQMVSSVQSHAEVMDRMRVNNCDRLVLPDDVLQEMIDAGVGPKPAD